MILTPELYPPRFQSTDRTGVLFAQLHKVNAVGSTFFGHITRVVDVTHTLYQFVELFRRRVAGKVPEIRRVPIDRDAGGVGHAGTGLALRRP